MIQKALSGTGMEATSCEHEIDKNKLPDWDKRLGKIYTCTKCGAKLINLPKLVSHNPRVRCSKKDRRRLRMLQQAVKDVQKE